MVTVERQDHLLSGAKVVLAVTDPAELLSQEPGQHSFGAEYDDAAEEFIQAVIRGDLIAEYVERWFDSRYQVKVEAVTSAGIVAYLTHIQGRDTT